MSVIVVKSETNEYRILVKAGDEELARQEAIKAAISAEEARLSAIAAVASEQVATEKAAQTVEDAASALASKVDAESAATASGGFASDSNVSALASEVARVASVAAQGIATTQAQNSSTSAGQSAESATDAADSSSLITNKAEVNITTAGNVLRADGTLFKSVSEVEFLRSRAAFVRSFAGTGINIDKLVYWDNFIRPNSSSLGIADSGQAYQTLNGAGWVITGNEATGIEGSISAIPLTNVGTRNAFISRTLMRNGPPNFNRRAGVGFFIDKDNFISLTSTRYECIIVKKTLGVDSIIASILYSNNNFNGIDFIDSQIDFTFRIYSNSARTLVFLQSDFLNISQVYNLNDTSYFNQINFYGFVSNDSTAGDIISSSLVKDL